MKNFLKYIEKMREEKRMQKEKRNYFHIEGTHWTVIYSETSDSFYAMDLTETEAITSTTSVIRPGYLIDSKTGNTQKLNSQIDRVAIKVFTGNVANNAEMARNEVAAFAHGKHWVDSGITDDNQPIIIMPYFPGSPIPETANQNDKKTLLTEFTLLDRLSAIIQVALQIQALQCDVVTLGSAEAERTSAEAESKNREAERKGAEAEKEGNFTTTSHARIHVDLKCSNIIVGRVPYHNQVKSTKGKKPTEHVTVANVIDYGSSKELDAKGFAETALAGLTLQAVPMEAITTDPEALISDLKETTGFLTPSSDVSALAPVFARLLGATNPYVGRRDSIAVSQGLYDLALLKDQIEAGFCFEGLMPATLQQPPFSITTFAQACAFKCFRDIEAPNDRAILENPQLPHVGYVLYKNQLLYVNKSAGTVSGRSNQKPKEFAARVSELSSLAETSSLSQTHLFLCNQAAGSEYHAVKKQSIDLILTDLITAFLQQMSHIEYAERPSIDEVLRFFTTLFVLINDIRELGAKETVTPEDERRIQIALLQLNIILYGGWQQPLFVKANSSGDQTALGTFAEFDFETLVTDDDALTQLSAVFCREDILERRRKLQSSDFIQVRVQDDSTQLVEAILRKLGDELSAHIDNVREKVSKLTHTATQHPRYKGMSVAQAFLSFSPALMKCLLTNELPAAATRDFTLSCIEHHEFIQHDFPTMHQDIIKGIKPDVLATLDQQNPNVFQFMQVCLAKGEEEAKIQEAIQQAFPEEKDVVAIYKIIVDQQSLLKPLMTSDQYDLLLKCASNAISKKVAGYLDKLQGYNDSDYRKFSFFGVFGHSVGQKRYAAKQFTQSLHCGEYQKFFAGLQKEHQAAITSKTLGKICQPLLQHLLGTVPKCK